MHAEWTELAFQKQLAGNAGLWVFPLSVLLVFLVLAALYESLTLPLVVILIVPMTLLLRDRGRVAHRRRQQHLHADRLDRARSAFAAQERDLDREFARARSKTGASTWEAIIDAARLRLRPILMTSIAFTAGVSSAGAVARRGRRDAQRDGCRGVRRHDRRDPASGSC